MPRIPYNQGSIGGSGMPTHPGAYRHSFRPNRLGEEFGGRGRAPVEVIARGLVDMPLGLRLLLIAGLIGGGYGSIVRDLVEGASNNGGTYVTLQVSSNCSPVITVARVGIEVVEAVQQISGGVVFRDNTRDVDLTENAKADLASYCATRGGNLADDLELVSGMVRNAMGTKTSDGKYGVLKVIDAFQNIVGGLLIGGAKGCSEGDGSTVTGTPTPTPEATSTLVPAQTQTPTLTSSTFCVEPLACELLNSRIRGIDPLTGEPLILNENAVAETTIARRIIMDYQRELPATIAPQDEEPYLISENIYVKGDQQYWNDLLGENTLRVVGDVLRSSSGIWSGLAQQFDPSLYSLVNNDFNNRGIIIVFNQGPSIIYNDRISIVENPEINAFDPLLQAASLLDRSSVSEETQPYTSATIWINGAYIAKGNVLPREFPKINDPVANYKLNMANEIGGLYMDILGRTPAYKDVFFKILDYYNEKYGTGLDVRSLTFVAQRDFGSTIWMLETLEQMIQNGEISRSSYNIFVKNAIQGLKGRL